MKDYLKNNRPTISLLIVTVFFISNLMTLFFDVITQSILLSPQDIKNFPSWYRLLTYPFYVGGLLRWLYTGIIIIISGYIIEKRLSKMKVITLIGSASIIGGLIYSIININDPINRPIASSTMITWGLSACAFILILKELRKSQLFEKIVAGLFIVSLLSIQDIDNGFLIGQIGVIIFGFVFGLIIKEEKTTANIT